MNKHKIIYQVHLSGGNVHSYTAHKIINENETHLKYDENDDNWNDDFSGKECASLKSSNEHDFIELTEIKLVDEKDTIKINSQTGLLELYVLLMAHFDKQKDLNEVKIRKFIEID